MSNLAESLLNRILILCDIKKLEGTAVQKRVISLVLLVSILLLCEMSTAELLVADDFKGGKLNDKYWKGQEESWDVKGGHLEIHRVEGDGNGDVDFGYGLIEFEDFGLRLDFHLLVDPFASKMELLFRANEDLHFYQLIITPADGAGRPNSARWYKREGNDRGTWNEYRELRTELPIEVVSKQWYTLALLGDGNMFQLYIKEQGALVFEKVTEWRDPKNLHPRGVFGIHTNQLQHYYIDNFYLYDRPGEVNLAVKSEGKLALTWASLRQ